ncbi:winged helix-turn-helix transcriptional regulator [Nocardia stercoris]|uniref:Transcriptional regulator n=1 Tax=Nocardia stercoris TaxID=2483361 RepID=A0A3M2LBK4_9NOCA|nr:helix-turn-helix domain-containing protein [Nocardia stercoris]RMI33315.1 transcriptional regulator [Nocardia stercoris]
MTRNARTYGHFCLLARALEQVGDRWSLLVIRDLLSGPKRFTDLMDRLGGITPKTLSQRLTEFEDSGLVVADREPGRREVRYRLTPAGADLEPILDALGDWGLRHAFRPPLPGEPLHPDHLLRAFTRAVEQAGDHAPARWYLRLDGLDYALTCDGHAWTLAPDTVPAQPDLTIDTDTGSFAAAAFGGADLEIDGAPAAVARFRDMLTTVAAAADRTDPAPAR